MPGPRASSTRIATSGTSTGSRPRRCRLCQAADVRRSRPRRCSLRGRSRHPLLRLRRRRGPEHLDAAPRRCTQLVGADHDHLPRGAEDKHTATQSAADQQLGTTALSTPSPVGPPGPGRAIVPAPSPQACRLPSLSPKPVAPKPGLRPTPPLSSRGDAGFGDRGRDRGSGHFADLGPPRSGAPNVMPRRRTAPSGADRPEPTAEVALAVGSGAPGTAAPPCLACPAGGIRWPT